MAKPKPEKGIKEDPDKKERKEFRHRLRLAGIIIDGNLDVERALQKIKGIGNRVSKSILQTLNIDKRTKIGSLDDVDIERIEKAIEDIDKNLPSWMLNRQRDPYSGEDIHLTGADLDMALREDINIQKELKSYRGIRHSLGLPVRGQRTRTSFRKGATIGVSRRKR